MLQLGIEDLICWFQFSYEETSHLNYLNGSGWNLNNFMTGTFLEKLAEQGEK